MLAMRGGVLGRLFRDVVGGLVEQDVLHPGCR
jgi:hypothetical protein